MDSVILHLFGPSERFQMIISSQRTCVVAEHEQNTRGGNYIEKHKLCMKKRPSHRTNIIDNELIMGPCHDEIFFCSCKNSSFLCSKEKNIANGQNTTEYDQQLLRQMIFAPFLGFIFHT